MIANESKWCQMIWDWDSMHEPPLVELMTCDDHGLRLTVWVWNNCSGWVQESGRLLEAIDGVAMNIALIQWPKLFTSTIYSTIFKHVFKHQSLYWTCICFGLRRDAADAARKATIRWSWVASRAEIMKHKEDGSWICPSHGSHWTGAYWPCSEDFARSKMRMSTDPAVIVTDYKWKSPKNTCVPMISNQPLLTTIVSRSPSSYLLSMAIDGPHCWIFLRWWGVVRKSHQCWGKGQCVEAELSPSREFSYLQKADEIGEIWEYIKFMLGDNYWDRWGHKISIEYRHSQC